MERHVQSRLLGKIINPRLHDFHEYAGREVVLGLEGKDEYGNKAIRYVTGILALGRDSFDIGLWEYVEGETGQANKVMPITPETPVVELLAPLMVDKLVNYSGHPTRAGELEYTIREDSSPASKRTLFIVQPKSKETTETKEE